jgi:hypothetical protein
VRGFFFASCAPSTGTENASRRWTTYPRRWRARDVVRKEKRQALVNVICKR